MERNGFLSMDNNRQPETELSKSLTSLVAGGMAGMLAKSVIAPLERLKILFQVTHEVFSLSKFPSIFARIIASEGYTGLWRGHSATLLRVAPYAGIQFMVFDMMKRMFIR